MCNKRPNKLIRASTARLPYVGVLPLMKNSEFLLHFKISLTSVQGDPC